MTDAAGKPSVLLVEDDATIRRLARIGLERGGFAVDVAADGATALAFLDDAAKRYAACVVDLGLPDMSGADVAKHVQRVQPAAALVMCSGSETVEIVPNATHLAKPYQPLSLGDFVRGVLKKADGA